MINEIHDPAGDWCVLFASLMPNNKAFLPAKSSRLINFCLLFQSLEFKLKSLCNYRAFSRIMRISLTVQNTKFNLILRSITRRFFSFKNASLFDSKQASYTAF